MYLVSGATGQVGGAVAKHLIARHPVRVLVRSKDRARTWADQGAEIAIGTFEDTNALTSALDGVVGAFLMQPNDFGSVDFVEDGHRRAAGYLRALHAAGCPRAVLLSSVGAQHATGNGPVKREHAFEQAFAEYPDVRVVRPAYFIENWANVLDAARGPGILPTFLVPGRAIPMVAVTDIGLHLARVLTDDNAPRLTELAGPEDYTPEQVATSLGRLLERDVRVAPENTDGAVLLFKRLGFTEHIAELMKEMYEGYINGTMAFETPPVRAGTSLERGLSSLLAQ